MKLGLLHPGEMGVSIGRSMLAAGHEVLWVATGRSAATADRARDFAPCENLQELAAAVDGICSVCPPHAAVDQAREVIDAGFTGVYLDANAIAPDTAADIADWFGTQYVDGGIIGPPAEKTGTTRLYLSGARAGEVADWFGGALDARVLNEEITAASTLKMAYAAYTKGSSALLLAVNALAEAGGVRDALVAEWSISQPAVEKRSEMAAKGTSRKAWRFVGEMEEISATFEALGLPGEFHAGAAKLYERMAGLKDRPSADLDDVLSEILKNRR